MNCTEQVRSDKKPTAATYVPGTPTLGLYQPRALRAAVTRSVVPTHVTRESRAVSTATGSRDVSLAVS